MDDSGESRWRDYVAKNKIQVGLGLMGLFLLLVGTVKILGQGGRQSSVEIISVDEGTSVSEEEIVVDVAGAVEQPGVYRVPKDARVDDALTAAGGFANDADRIWVRRYINLAQRVPDGAKIYIPMKGEADNNNTNKTNNYQFPITNDGGIAGVTTASTIGLGSGVEGKINVNTASTSELDALWGIGEKRAEAIISNRPYNSIEEIKSKAGIPSNVFERIVDEITAY